MNLAPLDLIVICVPLVIVLAIAFFMNRYTRSVADFLAGSRCAGRYVICTALGEILSSVMAMVMSLEVFSRTGFSMGFWSSFTVIVSFMLTLFGVVTFRFRETRCLTFHQLFEVRYSKGLRVFASFLNFFSAMINFGLIPAVGARFFVYFCGFPVTLQYGFVALPTFAVIMVVLMAMSLFLALTGGQISVMVTDCVEGMISGVCCLVVALFVVSAVSTAHMREALLSGKPGNSFVNPFDISSREDFNGWYIMLTLFWSIIIFRGNVWNHGFAAAAKSAHEGKMAAILATWRGYGHSAMMAIISIGAFTLLHHPSYAAQQALVKEGLKHIDSGQLRTQMTMPMALGILLGPGVKGAFCAIGLFGLLASQGIQLHNYGSTFLQDVILPLRKKPFEPKAHLAWLRRCYIGIGILVCTLSYLFKPVDYLQLMVYLIGSIYLGGVGPVVWGALYWKKGTTAGAWTSMITGSTLGLIFTAFQQLWTSIQPMLVSWAGHGSLAHYIAAHPDKCPVNGIQFTVTTAVCSAFGYVVVSLLTCKGAFDLDRMLHRGQYAIQTEENIPGTVSAGFKWGKLIGIDEHYTKGDKILAVATFFWVMAWKLVALSVLLWWVFIGRLSDAWWFGYTLNVGIRIPLVIAVFCTIWFTIGGVRDLIDLFKNLPRVKRNDADDGTVRNHHNTGEPAPIPEAVVPAKVPVEVKLVP